VALGRRRIGRYLPLSPLVHGLAAAVAGGAAVVVIAPFGALVAAMSGSIVAALILLGTNPDLARSVLSILGRAGRFRRQAPDGSPR